MAPPRSRSRQDDSQGEPRRASGLLLGHFGFLAHAVGARARREKVPLSAPARDRPLPAGARSASSVRRPFIESSAMGPVRGSGTSGRRSSCASNYQARVQPFWFTDNLAHVHVDAEASDGALAVVESVDRRGSMPPLHVHHNDEETFYVIAGQVSLFVGAEHIVLGSGPGRAGPAGRAAHPTASSPARRAELDHRHAGGLRRLRALRRRRRPRGGAPARRPAGRPGGDRRGGRRFGIELLGPPGTLPA